MVLSTASQLPHSRVQGLTSPAGVRPSSARPERGQDFLTSRSRRRNKFPALTAVVAGLGLGAGDVWLHAVLSHGGHPQGGPVPADDEPAALGHRGPALLPAALHVRPSLATICRPQRCVGATHTVAHWGLTTQGADEVEAADLDADQRSGSTEPAVASCSSRTRMQAGWQSAKDGCM